MYKKFFTPPISPHPSKPWIVKIKILKNYWEKINRIGKSKFTTTSTLNTIGTDISFALNNFESFFRISTSCFGMKKEKNSLFFKNRTFSFPVHTWKWNNFRNAQSEEKTKHKSGKKTKYVVFWWIILWKTLEFFFFHRTFIICQHLA